MLSKSAAMTAMKRLANSSRQQQQLVQINVQEAPTPAPANHIDVFWRAHGYVS